MRVGFRPTSIFVPSVIVMGRSVVSRIVRQGRPSYFLVKNGTGATADAP